MRLIGRTLDNFKLNNGEWVSAFKLEKLYGRNDKIKQIFVYGDSSRSECVAVVVVNREGLPHSNLKMSGDEILRVAVQDHMETIAEKNRIPSYEKIRLIHIENTDFNTLKLLYLNEVVRRHEAFAHYKQTIEKLYESAPAF